MNQPSPYPMTQQKQMDSEHDSLSISAILHVYWLHKEIFISLAGLFFFVVAIAVFQITPQYSATTEILVGTPKSRIVDIDAVLNEDLGHTTAVLGEVQVLKSRDLVKQVIMQNNLLSLAEFNPQLRDSKKGFFSFLNIKNWLSTDLLQSLGLSKTPKDISQQKKEERALIIATDIFLDKLDVSNVSNSLVIRVSFNSEDPELAPKIANSLTNAYTVSQLQAKFDATEKATSWLYNKLSHLRQKVEDSERVVESYRKKQGLTQGRGGSVLLVEQISDINSQFISAQAQRQVAEARLAQVNKLLESGTNIETAKEVLSSSLIQNLKTQESSVTRKISENSVEYGDKHPVMIRAKAELDDLRNRIKIEIKKIAFGLQNEVAIARTREHSLQKSLQRLEGESGSSGKAKVQLMALQREAASNKALFETFLERFKEASSMQNIQEADARIISLAETPLTHFYPNTKLFILLDLVLSILVSSVCVFLIELLHPGFRNPEDVESYLGHSTIGLIPTIEEDPFQHIIDNPHSILSESLNALCVSFALHDAQHVTKTIQITSSLPEEGKSILALCLAYRMASSEQKVLLVDADLRHPTITKKLNISGRMKGLSNLVISQKTDVSEFTIKDVKDGLSILSAGTEKFPNPSDFFSSKRLQTLIASLKQQFDFIIFDTPPLVVADARFLAKHIDKTVFVIRWNSTPKKTIKESLSQLEKSQPGTTLGIALQRINLKKFGSYDYPVYYGKYYSSNADK